MRRSFWRNEDGQSLIVVAGAFALLLGAVAFSIDQGYGFAERRTMVNAAQSGALAGGRLVAQSVIMTDTNNDNVPDTPVFAADEEAVFAEVRDFVSQNLGDPVSAPAYTLTVDFLEPDGTSQGQISCGLTDTSCPPALASTAIDSSVRDLRVTSSVTYRSLFASVIGQSTLTAAGRARSRVVGAPASFAGGRPRAIVRHYDPVDFTGTGCPLPCTDPTAADVVTFWDSNGDHTTYGQFKGVVDFSRFSTREGTVKQLMGGWDQSHSAYASPATATWPDITTSPAKCRGATDTNGNPNGFDTQGTNDLTYEKQCSIPNWNYYGFQGDVSLSAHWTTPPTGGEAPSDIGTRPLICNGSRPTYLIAPSCDDHAAGDWIETIQGTLGSGIADTLLKTIQDHGVETDLSGEVVPGTSNTRFGKALVVTVLLWDCGEEYKSNNALGSRWSLILPTGGGTDCSDADRWSGSSTPDRVHIFTMAQFTFYEGLADQNNAEIGGFWGGGFGDPESCVDLSQCQDLNAVSNTTLLIPDDN